MRLWSFLSKAAGISGSDINEVLCYGDSLTAGYYLFGTEFHPYGDTLAKLSDLNVKSVGMSGWTTGQMVDGTEDNNSEDCVGNTGDGLLVLMRKTSYDLVILMAGTNDLGTGFSIPDILNNIEVLVNMCLVSNSKARVVLLTVPPTGGEGMYESVRLRRRGVNEGLAKITSKHSTRVMLIDTDEALPNPGEHPEVPTAESVLWDNDTLHLSPAGSARLGEFIYTTLVARGVLKGRSEGDV
jgi:lysophospholipase L1-like esterase